MTWHQWHQMASRSRTTNLFSRLAWSKMASDQSCHWMGSALGAVAALAPPLKHTASIAKVELSLLMTAPYRVYVTAARIGCYPRSRVVIPRRTRAGHYPASR